MLLMHMKRRRKDNRDLSKNLDLCVILVYSEIFTLRKYDVVLCVTTNHNRHLDGVDALGLLLMGAIFLYESFKGQTIPAFLHV